MTDCYHHGGLIFARAASFMTESGNPHVPERVMFDRSTLSLQVICYEDEVPLPLVE